MHQVIGITASIGQKDMNKFAKLLVEGRSYMIKKFQVSRQVRKFNAVPNKQSIFFTSWTAVDELSADLATNLPHYFFNFVDFEDLDHKGRKGDGLVGTHPQYLFMFQPLVLH